MSRSKRHHPIHGLTCSESDKYFKHRAAKKYRKAEKTAIRLNSEIMPLQLENTNQFDCAKDGKIYYMTPWHPWRMMMK